MASMEDLIATLGGGMQVGQQANDLKDLQAKLAQTLHPTIPVYRPIPPANTNSTGSSGPQPPPAPASSWSSPPPAGSGANAFLGSQHQHQHQHHMSSSPSRQMANGFSSSPGVKSSINSARNVGFTIPPPASGGAGAGAVPIQAGNGNGRGAPAPAQPAVGRGSPMDTGGFADDAFKPLWTQGNGVSASPGFGRR